MFFENKECYFMRKPPEIASTRGKEQSFLDIVCKEKKSDAIESMEWSRDQLDTKRKSLFLDYIQDLWITPAQEDVLNILTEIFTPEEEYWLLNRLDTPTSWLLYFAKSKKTYTNWKERQAQEKIEKWYLAQITQKVEPQIITTPLAHHSNGKRMIVATEDILSTRKKQKIKGKLLQVKTEIVETWKDWLIVRIHKWQRHQIRAHLASLWAPIVGEKLYSASEENTLQLFSLWCTIN